MVSMNSVNKKRKVIRSEGREMIVRVYHFLKDEYKFMRENNSDKCDLSPLANVRRRTADATGVSERTVTKFLHEERILASSASSVMKHKNKRQSKGYKALGLDIDDIKAYVSTAPDYDYEEEEEEEEKDDDGKMDEISVKYVKVEPKEEVETDIECDESDTNYDDFNVTIKKEEPSDKYILGD